MYAVVEELERRAAEAGESGNHTAALHLFREALTTYRSTDITDVWREHYLLICIGVTHVATCDASAGYLVE